MPYGALFNSTAGSFQFGLLIDPPTRQTRQTINESLIPGSNNTVIDIIGKPVTKILGRGVFQSFASLTTFEGAVGLSGSLIYSEGAFNVILVAIERTEVTRSQVQLANIEFWIIP